MTYAEARELYGSVECVFAYYYKHYFSYKGTAPDGAELLLEFGGHSDDIYKMSVSVGDVEYIPLESPHETCKVKIKKDGVEIFNTDNI